MGPTFSGSCSNFNVKMVCNGGAETALPQDSDPRGFSVDASTGAITGTPQRPTKPSGEPYRMRLRAVDASLRQQRTTLERVHAMILLA